MTTETRGGRPTLEGARVLVVGASSGIGAAVAQHAMSQGARVCVAARRAEKLAELCQGNGAARAVAADLSDLSDCRRIVTEAVAHLGGLDLLVNAAGAGTLATLCDLDPASWHHDYDVNVVGPTVVCSAALPHLSPGGLASFISSTSATEERWGLSSYAASKAALDSTIRTWRLEHPDRRFQRVVMGPTYPTDFGSGFDPELAVVAVERWTAAGCASTSMDTDGVGRHLTGLWALSLADPAIDVPDVRLELRAVP